MIAAFKKVAHRVRRPGADVGKEHKKCAPKKTHKRKKS